jgi:hypothetical protein
VFTLAWATAVKIERKGKGTEEERWVRIKRKRDYVVGYRSNRWTKPSKGIARLFLYKYVSIYTRTCNSRTWFIGGQDSNHLSISHAILAHPLG